MNKLFKKLFAPIAILSMALGVSISVNHQSEVVGANALTYSHTITAKTWSAYGAQTLTGISWDAQATGGAYWGYDATKGQQFGSSGASASALSLTTSGIAGTITSVKVSTSGAASVVATLTVSVGGVTYSPASSTITASDTQYTFTGSSSGTISINWANSSAKALYLKALSVDYSSGSTLQSIAITTPPTKTQYYVGDTFDKTGMVVMASYSSGSPVNVTSSVQINPSTMLISTTYVQISYTEGTTVTVNQPVTVLEVVLNTIQIKTLPSKTTFGLGEIFSSEGLIIYANYNNGTVDVDSGYSVSGIDTMVLGNQTATVSYQGKTTTYSVKVTNQGANFETPIISDLIISEYIEGSSNNKAIELYNGTGSAVDLSSYSLVQYNNGSQTITSTLTLSGTINNKDTYVIGHGSASAEIKAIADTTNSTVIAFNGNDAIGLRKGSTVIDLFGIPGNSLNYAIDNTYVRKSSVKSPNSTWEQSEWSLFSIDTISNLGTHTGLSDPITYLDQVSAFVNYVMVFGAGAQGSCVSIFNEINTEFGLMDLQSQTIFNGYSADSSITAPSSQQAKARFLYLAAFASANPSSPVRNGTFSTTRNNLIAAVTIGAIGLTSILAYYFINKKKAFR